MNTIAFDCGSSFIKAALFDANGNALKIFRKQAPTVCPEKDLTDTTHIESLISLVIDMFKTLLDEADNDICLCVCNEMHGFLLTDETGTPITDYISWQHELDNSSSLELSAFAILSDDQYKQEIKKSGMPLRRGLPSVNLLYLSKNNFLESLKHPIYFYTLGDYVIKILSGRQPLCHSTNAAATGLFNLIANDWNKTLLKVIAPKNINFPEIGTDSFEVEMEGKHIKFFPALGDQQAALYGAGLSSDSMLSFNIGTGGQVSKILSSAEFSANYQVRPFLSGKYIKTIPHVPSGRALNVYFRFFKDILQKFNVMQSDADIWRVILEAESKAVDDCGMKCDLSFFENAVSTKTTGSIANIGEYSLTVGNLMRCIINRVSNNFLKAAEKIEPNPTNVKKVLFSGGVARNIKSVRDKILIKYDTADYEVAAHDTLYGLFRYVT